MKSLVRMELKPMTENRAGCTYASRGKHFHTLTMKTLEQTFHELTALISDQTSDIALAMAELRSVAAERDRLKIELDRLRAAEADAAETDSVNADLRTVNARLVADLAAAMERLAHAEAILRAKA